MNNVSEIDRRRGINYVTEIPDIKVGNLPFTDGIGKISLGLAGRVAQRLNLHLSDKVCRHEQRRSLFSTACFFV